MYNKDLNTLNALIDSSISEAYNNINNNLLSDTRFFLNHMEIIKHQRDILENLYSYVSQLSSTPPQAHIISAFIHWKRPAFQYQPALVYGFGFCACTRAAVTYVCPIPHTVTDIRQMEFLFFCSRNIGVHAANGLSLFIRICLRFYIHFGRTSLLIRRRSLCGFYIQKDTSTDKLHPFCQTVRQKSE